MDELNGRTAHVWGGGDRTEAVTAQLAATIAKALPLYDQNGSIAALNSSGQLTLVSRNAFRP